MPDNVVTPDGTEWVVGRRWLPRPPRWVGTASRDRRDGEPQPTKASEWWEGVANAGDLGGGPDDLRGIVLVIGGLIAVVLAVVFVGFVLPALVFVVDLLFVLVVAGVAVLARVLFRRPWIVVARSSEHTYEWAVVGWKASGAAIEIVKRVITRGESLDDVRGRLL